MNPYRHFIGEIKGALQSMQAAGELPEKLDFSAITAEPPRDPAHGDIATNAAMVLAKAAGKKPRDIAEPLLARLKANPDVVDGAVAGPGFINLKIADGFWRERLSDCLKAGIAYGDSRMGGGQEGQRRIRLGQPDRSAARGARARRGGGRCAGQPAGQGGLCRHQGILHQRCRRAGRQARPVDLPALSRGAGRSHRADSRGPLSRRVPQGGRCGDRQARRRALDRQARGRLAARDARLRHRRPDGRDQDRPRDAGRPYRRLFVGARAGRFGRRRSRLPGAERART